MSPEKQRIAIAEAIPGLRWEITSDYSERWIWPSDEVTGPPDEDLNAMHEAEKTLTEQQFSNYGWMILGGGNIECRDFLAATAAQRCEAFLKILNLWEEQP